MISCVYTYVYVCMCSVSWDWDDVKPERFFVGHNSFYTRCLHQTGTKISKIGLKQSCPLGRANYVPTGMKSERNRCKHISILDRYWFREKACAQELQKQYRILVQRMGCLQTTEVYCISGDRALI